MGLYWGHDSVVYSKLVPFSVKKKGPFNFAQKFYKKITLKNAKGHFCPQELERHKLPLSKR